MFLPSERISAIRSEPMATSTSPEDAFAPLSPIVLVTGKGGVGKTTTSAALALSLAGAGHRVAVLTIDPARRLADSLGIGPLSNDPQRVPLEGMHLDAARMEAPDGAIAELRPAEGLSPELRALSLLCQTILSLNEFAYVE